MSGDTRQDAPTLGRTSGGAWVPALDISLLDERMDNAMRRASGSIGLDISFDRGRMRALKDTAASALDAGLGAAGPLFMRIGRGAFEAGFLSIGSSLDPREVGGEILSEFHAEAGSAFQAAKAALAADALAHMKARGLDETQCRTVIAAANEAFCVPDKDRYTREALPFVKTVAAPATQGVVGGVIAAAGIIALVRAPHVGVIGGALAGGLVYYLARRRARGRCERILRLLPRNLYQMLATEWNANVRRYADIVNAGLGQG